MITTGNLDNDDEAMSNDGKDAKFSRRRITGKRRKVEESDEDVEMKSS